MNVLADILSHKAEEVALRKEAIPAEILREKPLFARTTLSLTSALNEREFAVIAEVKKASPSRGVIRDVYDPVGIALEYERAGASAISVLTDSKFFQGTLDDLEAVRESVGLPLLRKDFIVDPYQLEESKAAGADAVLLIVAALSRRMLGDLSAGAKSLGMECLVEIHTVGDLESAVECGCTLIGINNRDLATFTTDVGTTLGLVAGIPPGTLCVSESGISSQSDIVALRSAGVLAVLIGEAFMREKNPGDALVRFLQLAETPS